MHMAYGKTPKEAIVLSDSVYHSYRGEYFLGQTDSIWFGKTLYAWGGLINPPDSNVDLYLNAYTISNFASVSVTAQGWLSSKLSGTMKLSRMLAAGNQAMDPPNLPRVQIQSASRVTKIPVGGTYTFVRRVEPSVTLTKHDFQGMYIIPPGSSFILFFLPVPEEVYVRIAFGWWEEEHNDLEQ